jgi:hypothetical protein
MEMKSGSFVAQANACISFIAPQVIVHTSDIRSAGTDASVYVILRGALGATGKSFLKNSTIDCFERGQSDEFTVSGCSGRLPRARFVCLTQSSQQPKARAVLDR